MPILIHSNKKPKVNSQQSTVNSQQSTVNSQQSTVNSQQSTVNSQQSTVNSQITIQVDFLSKVWLRCCLPALRKSILVRIRIAVL
jgi:beta-lactamase regulating signal transducer with metallopeptidase domain